MWPQTSSVSSSVFPIARTFSSSLSPFLSLQYHLCLPHSQNLSLPLSFPSNITSSQKPSLTTLTKKDIKDPSLSLHLFFIYICVLFTEVYFTYSKVHRSQESILMSFDSYAPLCDPHPQDRNASSFPASSHVIALPTTLLCCTGSQPTISLFL